jgi:hypothetical protein
MEAAKLAVIQDGTADSSVAAARLVGMTKPGSNLGQIGLTFGVPGILSATESLLGDTIHELFFAVQPHSPL